MKPGKRDTLSVNMSLVTLVSCRQMTSAGSSWSTFGKSARLRMPFMFQVNILSPPTAWTTSGPSWQSLVCSVLMSGSTMEPSIPCNLFHKYLNECYELDACLFRPLSYNEPASKSIFFVGFCNFIQIIFSHKI